MILDFLKAVLIIAVILVIIILTLQYVTQYHDILMTTADDAKADMKLKPADFIKDIVLVRNLLSSEIPSNHELIGKLDRFIAKHDLTDLDEICHDGDFSALQNNIAYRNPVKNTIEQYNAMISAPQTLEETEQKIKRFENNKFFMFCLNLYHKIAKATQNLPKIQKQINTNVKQVKDYAADLKKSAAEVPYTRQYGNKPYFNDKDKVSSIRAQLLDETSSQREPSIKQGETSIADVNEDIPKAVNQNQNDTDNKDRAAQSENNFTIVNIEKKTSRKSGKHFAVKDSATKTGKADTLSEQPEEHSGNSTESDNPIANEVPIITIKPKNKRTKSKGEWLG